MDTTKPIIEIKGIGKEYNITHQRGGYIALRDILAGILKNPFRFAKHKAKQIAGFEAKEAFWALRDVSFDVMPGEIIGIIGANGAGKSTLLKILTGITPPTEGEIIMRGRVASLLEVGTGFHPELTGRENIFLNGAILGMTKKEIARKFDEIVAFSGVEKFLDTPVKYYSSGMYVRLAFSVAAHMEPDILLIDEVLAVGDAEFQKKCLGKMEEVTHKDGRTILFVSHNLSAIQQLCKKTVLIEKGKVKFFGPTAEAMLIYRNGNDKSNLLFIPDSPVGEHEIKMVGAELNYEGTSLDNGKELKVTVELVVEKAEKFSSYIFVSREGTLSFVSSNLHMQDSQKECAPGKYELIFVIPPYLLNPGWHAVGIMLADSTGNSHQFLNVKDVIQFELKDDEYRRNVYYKDWQGAVSPILETSISLKK